MSRKTRRQRKARSALAYLCTLFSMAREGFTDDQLIRFAGHYANSEARFARAIADRRKARIEADAMRAVRQYESEAGSLPTEWVHHDR